MPCATFVLSTGRCGTQWIAAALASALGSQARVEHEPLHDKYSPRLMLGLNDPAKLEARSARAVLAHADAIARELDRRDYVETGHPCWSSLPWLAERFAGRIRVVHLVRHPVPTACSWLSHGAFVPPLLPGLPAHELLQPTDGGVSFPEYRATWPALTPLEKCLFYWAEVNAFGLRLERATPAPWLRLPYEELFDLRSDALARLLQFLGWPAETIGRIDRGERVDQFRYHLPQWPDPELVARHPAVGSVAAALGYDPAQFAVAELRARFFTGGAT